MNYTQLILFVIACCVAELGSVQADEVRPNRKVEPARLTEVKWTDGFWKQRLDTCRDKTIPAM